jgi:CRISPR-associated protein Cas2
MGLNTAVDWIVCYDMADRKRLARVFKLLKANGLPLQRSVFLVHVSSAGMAQLQAQLNSLINPQQDDVRVYRLPQGGYRVVLGNSLIPQGMLLGEEFNAW